MSNCCASSASVFSPLTAAKATFALKAGVWFRRGRLVIVSPGLQPFWLLSGRNSTYPDVQISWASSVGSISALGLPALSETPEVTADGTTGTVAGNVTLYCSGNSGGNACGFYAVITSLKIQLPTTVAGYPQIDSVTSELSSIGYPTSWVVPAVNEVL